jgi:hypothetical protein
MYWPETLRAEALAEIYIYIDKYYKILPKSEGKVTGIGIEFLDNDVDALRHSYVSGVFTQEYGEVLANVFGVMNELAPGLGSSTSYSSNSKNMDLWNNSVGRKYGEKTKSRLKLFKLLIKALKRGELIISPDDDPRKFTGKVFDLHSLKDKVIVIKESKKGKNLMYFDLREMKILSRQEFVSQIKLGYYPKYEIRVIKNEDTPVSKKGEVIPNLG